MGVCGSGKSVVASAIAQRHGWRFLDADDFHPPENVAKMASGTPLADADRIPWLDALNAALVSASKEHQRAVLACSALKSIYRDRLRQQGIALQFILLEAPPELLMQRMRSRPDHFMPATLLDSQLQTLEIPSHALRIDVSPPLPQVIESVEAALAHKGLV